MVRILSKLCCPALVIAELPVFGPALPACHLGHTPLNALAAQSLTPNSTSLNPMHGRVSHWNLGYFGLRYEITPSNRTSADHDQVKHTPASCPLPSWAQVTSSVGSSPEPGRSLHPLHEVPPISEAEPDSVHPHKVPP